MYEWKRQVKRSEMKERKVDQIFKLTSNANRNKCTKKATLTKLIA